MGKKLTIECVRGLFEEEGYILLTKEYKNAHQKLDYICSEGHKHAIRWSDWRQGHRCPYCVGVGKPNIKFIESEFKIKGYKLLSDCYVNAKIPLKYKCLNGHIGYVRWDNWRQGQRCPHCAGNAKLIIGFIRSEFVKEEYKLLTIEYKNSKQKLEYVCKNDHRGRITWGRWQQGQRCKKCAALRFSERFSGENSPYWKDYSKEDLKKIHNYRNCVFRLTSGNYRKYKNIINPLNLNRIRGEYHLDHIYPIMEGFRNNIPVNIIANPNNLQMLSEHDNILKRDKVDISLKELHDRYNHWEAEKCLIT